MEQGSPLEYRTGLASIELATPATGRWLRGRSVKERLARLDGERLNQLTHGCGFLLSLIGGGVIVHQAVATGGVWRVVGCTVFALAMILLYLASTLSHSFTDERRRGRYRLLDQVCIFLMAAGSYTPLGMVHLREGAGVWILVTMWVLALMGIVDRCVTGHERIRLTYFILVGWVPIFAIGTIFSVGGTFAVSLVVAGGLCYTLGSWFLVNDHRHPCLHAIWHLMTIAGSTCHYMFLLWFVAM